MAEDAERSDVEQEEEEEIPPRKSVGHEERTEAVEELPKRSYREMISHPVGLVFNVRMLRRVVQIVFILGINAYFFASWNGGEQFIAFWRNISLLVPALPIIAPLQAPAGILAGSFDTFERELVSAIFPFFTLGTMIIILTIVGRAGCGWVCPIGTLQDFATLPKRTKIRPAPSTETEMRRVKAYIFIIVMFLAVWVGLSTLTGTSEAIVAALGPFAAAAFDPFSPAYILFVALPSIVSRGLWPTGLGNLWYVLQWGWFLPHSHS